MKLINIQTIDKYPDNYIWLSEEQKNKILSYMQGVQRLCDYYYDKYFTNAEQKSLKLYQHTLTSLTGSKNAYATMGIMVEKWGQNNTWILATKEDAQRYDEENDNTTEQVIEQINELIDYGDIQ